MLIASSLMLTACGTSTISDKRINYDGIVDSRLRADCKPVALPKRALTKAEVKRYWKIDRARLVKCNGEKSEIIRNLDNVFKRV